jgi:hypothetical protein
MGGPIECGWCGGLGRYVHETTCIDSETVNLSTRWQLDHIEECPQRREEAAR